MIVYSSSRGRPDDSIEQAAEITPRVLSAAVRVER